MLLHVFIGSLCEMEGFAKEAFALSGGFCGVVFKHSQHGASGLTAAGKSRNGPY